MQIPEMDVGYCMDYLMLLYLRQTWIYSIYSIIGLSCARLCHEVTVAKLMLAVSLQNILD